MGNGRRRGDSNGDLQRWMGRVDEKLISLATELKEERDTAVVYRREIRDRVTQLESTLNKVDGHVALTAAAVAEMKPQVADYWQNRAKAQGIAWMARLVWLGLGGFGSLVLMEVLKRLLR